MLPPFDAVIFDMDGLALDTGPTYIHAWKRAAADFGVCLEEEFCHHLFGRHADDVAIALEEKIGKPFDRERFNELATSYWRAHIAAHGIAPMPGLKPLLELLTESRIPYALATNSDGPYARECLESAGIAAWFPETISRDQVANGKPEPDLFLEAARRLHTPPPRCLVLEDSETGLRAARNAGMPALLVLNRPASAELTSMALATFPSLNAVAATIARSSPHRKENIT